MRRRTHSVRARLDRLEAREVPAGNLTVTFSALTHTLTVVGDANGDDVTVEAVPADHTQFTLTSTSDTFNNHASPYTSPTGVKNFVFKMGAGSDTISFDKTSGPITVEGSVTINGGNGANSVSATDLTVGKNLSVANSAHATGNVVYLTDFSAGGSVTVKNAGGGSLTVFQRDAAGVSTVKGSVTVTNGTGTDQFDLIDTNVDGIVTINNGHGGAGGAGTVSIFNVYNTAFRSVIGGNLTVTYLDGNTLGYDALADTEVLGNVTYNRGSGTFSTHMDGYVTKQPVLIHGNLTITGTGASSVAFGTNTGFGNGSGLIVGKKFTLTSGGGTAETLDFRNFQVGGNTSIKLGDGGNTVTIDDSEFDGTFTLMSRAGSDTVNIEATTGTTSATEFHKAVLIDLGTGNNATNLADNGNPPDAGQEVVAWSTFVIEGSGSDSLFPSNVLFPNGGFVNFT